MIILRQKYYSKIKNKLIKKALENFDKTEDTETFKKLVKTANEGGTDVIATKGLAGHFNAEKVNGRDKIVLGDSHLRKLGVLSHELGHAQNSKKKGPTGSMQRLYERTGVMGKKGKAAALVAGVGTGFGTGYRAGKKEAETGEKESVTSKLLPGAVVLTPNTPALVSEAAASKRGIKLMKEAGASKNVIKHAKRGYAYSYGTYALAPAIALTASYGSHALGKLAGKLEHRKKGKNKDK